MTHNQINCLAAVLSETARYNTAQQSVEAGQQSNLSLSPSLSVCLTSSDIWLFHASYTSTLRFRRLILVYGSGKVASHRLAPALKCQRRRQLRREGPACCSQSAQSLRVRTTNPELRFSLAQLLLNLPKV